jgi:hypothetical protein
MATNTLTPDSDNRTQQHYDDEFNKIVSSGQLNDAEKSTAQQNSGGASNGAGHSAVTPGGIKAAEADGNKPKTTDASFKFNGAKKDESDGGKKKGNILNNLKNKVMRRWLIGALVSLAIGGGGFTAFNILSGPAEFIHFAKLLEEFHLKDDQDFMDERASKLIMNSKKRVNSVDNNELHNLNWAGNWIATHFEDKMIANGITPEYNNGRMRSMTIDLTKPQGQSAYQAIKQRGLKTAAIKEAKDGKKVTVDFDIKLGSARDRRYAVRTVVGVMQMSKISSAIASRSLIIRAGVDFHPLKNLTRAADEKLIDFYKRFKEARNKAIKEGASGDTRTVTVTEDGVGEGAAAVNEGGGETADAANELSEIARDTSVDVETRTARMQAALGKGVGPTAFVGLVCGIKEVGDEVGKMRYLNIIIPMIRIGGMVITTGYQIMDGKDVTPEQLGALKEYLDDPKTGLSWSDARSIQMETGQKPTGPDLPENSKPGNAKKPGFFNLVDESLAVIPGSGEVCDAVNTTAGGIILSAVGILASATGPVGFFAGAASEGAQQLLLSQLLPPLVKWLAGDMVDPEARGPAYGNTANVGVRLMGNAAANTHGGLKLNKQEDFDLVAERTIELQNIRENQSMYARYLDLDNTHSLAAQTLFQNSSFKNANNFVASLTRLPATIISSAASPLTLFTGKASAQGATERYDYGFDKFGFSLEERDDERFDDPYANADIVEPKLEELNDKYSKCFLTRIDPVTFALTYLQPSTYEEEEDPDCARTTTAAMGEQGEYRLAGVQQNEELLRYRFYLADMVAAKSLGCHEGIDETACIELGIGKAPEAALENQGDEGGAVDPSGNVDIANINEPSDNIKCADGTKDLGVKIAKRGENDVKIRLCAIPDLPCGGMECRAGNKYSVEGADGKTIVNSRTSLAWLKLVQAAKADGLNMYANSAYRSNQHQADLYAAFQRGTGNTAAKPGFSNHEMGNAIDFGNANFNSIDYNDKWYNWLKTHAIKYGMKALVDGEAWHWSPTGK